MKTMIFLCFLSTKKIVGWFLLTNRLWLDGFWALKKMLDGFEKTNHTVDVFMMFLKLGFGFSASSQGLLWITVGARVSPET